MVSSLYVPITLRGSNTPSRYWSCAESHHPPILSFSIIPYSFTLIAHPSSIINNISHKSTRNCKNLGKGGHSHSSSQVFVIADQATCFSSTSPLPIRTQLFFQTSNSNLLGSSITSFTLFKNVTASRPSINL